MKTKLLALVATLGMVASASAVKINNNLSINGFIDGSYQSTNDERNPASDDQSLGLDEVELNFVLNVGNVSGLVAIDTDAAEDEDADDARDTLFNIEQAHFTYNISDAISATFGRYGSALGFEREDPAGLYTFSRAYGDDAFNLGNVDANVVEGLTVTYSADSITLAASLENAVGANLQNDDLNLELSFAYSGFDGVNIGGGYFFDNRNAAADEVNVLNIHASKQIGKLFVAAEYIELMQDNRDRDGYLLLADYDFNSKIGAALRISSNENVGSNGDYDKITIAPNYAITDSLGAILEYSDISNNTADSQQYAVELTYTF
jgi:hypothetical protein